MSIEGTSSSFWMQGLQTLAQYTPMPVKASIVGSIAGGDALIKKVESIWTSYHLSNESLSDGDRLSLERDLLFYEGASELDAEIAMHCLKIILPYIPVAIILARRCWS